MFARILVALPVMAMTGRKYLKAVGVGAVTVALLMVAGLTIAQTFTARVQTPVGGILGVRNNSATTLFAGQAVKPDTNSFELLPDSAKGSPGTSTAVLVKNKWRFALPETTTVSRDTLPGFLLWARCTGSTGGGTDSVIIVGKKPLDPGASLINGTTVRSIYLVNVGGDSAFYFDTYISIDSIYCNTAQTNLDTLRFYQMTLFGVSKADSANGVTSIATVLDDSIEAHSWGRTVTSRIGARARVVVNGNTTKVFPWDKLRFGTSGYVKHTEKPLRVVPLDPTKYAGADTMVVTAVESISDSTFGYAIDYTGTTGDTTSMLLRQY